MVDVDYPEYLQPLHRNVSLSPEKRIISRVTKLVCTFYARKICLSSWITKTSFKAQLNSRMVRAVIKLKQKR